MIDIFWYIYCDVVSDNFLFLFELLYAKSTCNSTLFVVQRDFIYWNLWMYWPMRSRLTELRSWFHQEEKQITEKMTVWWRSPLVLPMWRIFQLQSSSWEFCSTRIEIPREYAFDRIQLCIPIVFSWLWLCLIVLSAMNAVIENIFNLLCYCFLILFLLHLCSLHHVISCC